MLFNRLIPGAEVLLALVAVAVGTRWVLPAVATAAAPQPGGAAATTESLRDLERRVREAAQKVLPFVVAVKGLEGSPPKHHQPFASGVIISSDGLILSQYHVSHARGGDYENSLPAGHRMTVILHDGRQLDAELLGADRTYDISLLRIVKAGKYPHAPLEDKAAPPLGEWVLKLGHPHGYRPGRAPVVRAGRVLCQEKDTFITDCPVSGGDSGGPLFDLNGRLVGIIRNGTGHGKLQQDAEGGPRQRGVIFFACSTSSLIRSRLESMRRGEISPLDGASLGNMLERLQEAKTLPVADWTQGAGALAAAGKAVSAARASVVTIRDVGRASSLPQGHDAHTTALATVVDSSGLLLTKASELPAEPKCQLPDGSVVSCDVLGVDTATDLALLKVAAKGLTAIEWADDMAGPAGTMLAVPGPQATPLAIGIVSVPRRELKGPFPDKIVRRPRSPAMLPELIGSTVQGRGYWIEHAEGDAAAAGILPGDVIVSIGDRPVRGQQDLAACIKGRGTGERLPVSLLRGGKTLEVSLELRGRGQPIFSFRADDFPVIFEHDAPLMARECGGPIVRLDGKAVGITIARVGAHGCMAIPADQIQRLLPRLKSGELAANWVKPEPAAKASSDATEPKPGKPVTITLDELKRRLSERRDRFKSLLVEYEVVSEAHVEPRLLMAWNLHAVRDDHEQHRVAFAGAKRYAQVLRPELSLWYVPLDQIIPDPHAPPSVVQAVEQQRQIGAERKARGETGHLFARTRGEELRYVFDGSKCFQWWAQQMGPVPPSHYFAPAMYLAGLGLRPIDPEPSAQTRKSQQQFWFPENFGIYEKSRLLPTTEPVEGSPCVVAECQWVYEADGKREVIHDKIWFDPKLHYAPRKWEQRRADGSLLNLRTNTQFDELASGCWLAWESTWTRGTPTWAAPKLRNQPAYSYRMRLRKARVNDVSDEQFKP